MELMVNIDLKSLPMQISYRDKILLIGSCFTEHIGDSLEELKFSVLQNPNGIIFDPISVSKSLLSYINAKQYKGSDLFQLNELWHSWQHHSRFSNINKEECLRSINESQTKAHEFLKEADWIIVTLGSSFSYQFINSSEYSKAPPKERFGEAVANCHKAPQQWFKKQLLEANNIISALDDCLGQLLQFNPGLKIIFTISPVRYIRDGVIDNNRSKAKLIEATHDLVNRYEQAYYFPAYELVIDVLRDYRFYDADLAHPNCMATEFVMEKFTDACIDEESQKIMEEIKPIITAAKHKAFQPETNAHRQFLHSQFERTKDLQNNYPFIDLSKELEYFFQKFDTL